MKLVEINWAPTKSQLRQFGVACAFVLPLLGWLGKVGGSGLTFLMVIGITIAALSFVWPKAVNGLFVGLTLALAPIGMVVGEVAMLWLFFGLFLPIGLVFRLIGRDALQRRIDKDASTYWEAKREPEKVSNYYRRY